MGCRTDSQLLQRVQSVECVAIDGRQRIGAQIKTLQRAQPTETLRSQRTQTVARKVQVEQRRETQKRTHRVLQNRRQSIATQVPKIAANAPR